MKRINKILLTLGLTGIVSLSAAVLTSCKEDPITVSFNTSGVVTLSDVSVEVGGELTLPVPEKEGYRFEGWYVNAEFSGEPVTSIVAESDVTYYAKWTQLYAVTLDANGGTLSTTTVYLEKGANVYEALANYVPQKDGLTFGAWFNGNAELSQTTTMGEAALTLTAQYKVAYTTEIYTQKLDLSGYEKAETLVEYEYVGKAITSSQSVTGFKEVVKDASESTGATVTSKDALSETASENVFRHYFDRETYTVMFNPNYPGEGGVATTKTETVLYGTEITVPNDYEYEGYCLVGWSTSATDSKALYNAYYVDTVLYNKGESKARTPDKFTPERTTVLYAVWAKGYEDLFGGDDNVYLFEGGDVAYLSRGNVFFKGEYEAEFGEVYFGDLVGKVYDNNTFSYFNDGKVFTLRKGQGLDKSTTLTLVNNTATYTKNGEQSGGTFVRGEEEDCFVITYTTGALSGQEITIKTRIMSVTDEDGKTSNQAVFNVRNEEDVALCEKFGGLLRIMINDGAIGTYYPIISLDGFGVATLTAPTSESTYFYTLEDSRLTLSSTEGGSSALDAMIVDINDVMVYVLYEEWLDQSFTLASGDVLTLDGGCEAIYTVGGETKEGYYSVAESLFGSLVTVWSGESEYKFLIKTNQEDKPVVGGEAGETETVTTYSIESKPVGYAEYRYVESGSVYRAPLLVLDETVAGKATLYAQNAETGEYVKVSVGGYQLVDEYYVYTVEEEFAADGLNETPFDLTKVKSVVFQVNATATEYSLMYWKSYTTEGNETTDYVKNYTSVSGATLQMVGGFAFLKVENEPTFIGAYATQDGLTTIIDGNEYRYVELGEDGTFVKLDYAPYSANLLTENDDVNKMEYVEFDGKGKATYVKVITAATKDTPAVTERTEGATKDTGDTTFSGEKIYQFISSDGTLTFKYINVPDTKYIAKFHDTYNGRYATQDGLVLELDGFGYKAEYRDANFENYVGLYTVTDKDEITFYVEDTETIYYFDLKSDKAFTVRADEYGAYLLVDNQSIEAYIDLDGYGKASIYTLKEENGEAVEEYIDQNATYEQNGSIFTIQYKDGTEQVTIEAKLSTITISGTVYNAVVVVRREAVRVYVNEDDWSVLILDDIGNATKYNEEGVKEEGTYLLVTENFLYYANNDLDDACVYEYDAEKGTATPVKFDRRSYYTSDLERLLFSEYGYAYFGNTRYYYHEDENGNVLLYRQALEGETPNQYGFVEDDMFGSFAGDVKEYGGKTYYKSSGFGINLDRVKATENAYPIQISNSDQTKYALQALTFNPGADEEYIAMGSVNLNGVAYDCYVIRERNDEGKLELYVSLGYYRFYIDVTYNGTENTYEVTRLEYVRSLYSYTYLYSYFLNAIFFGTELENDYGMVHICQEYDAEGTITKQYIIGEFLERSGLKDEDGNIISFTEAKYSYNRGIYGAEFTAEDGYTYTLYFGLQYQSAMGRYGYTVAALARHQTITTDNGYEVTVERVVYSELPTISAGTIYTVSLKKGGEALKAEALLSDGSTIYYVVRERAAAAEGESIGKILSTKYYHIKLVEEEQSDSVEGEDVGVAFYTSATVEEETVKTYYMENGVVYVDISETRGVTYIAMANAIHAATESTYDEATKTYTVKVSGGATFTVEMLEGGFVDVTQTASDNA